MPTDNSQLVLCYNRGCGNTFNPDENTQDSCTYHPGNPVFHDAYKGWSCCKRKCTDFTEFLNIKGCTVSFHTNVKPPEPEKPVVDKATANDVIEYNAPQIKPVTASRPPLSTSLELMKPSISSSLQTQFESMIIKEVTTAANVGDVPLGTACKHGGCKATYDGPSSPAGPCIHHPGCPVFHEGLKFWTCCQKRTTDFAAFLDQVGCATSDHHQWTKPKSLGEDTQSCRFDWHQTGSHVVVSLYAKKYDPYKSTVELNPIRARVHVEFPLEEAAFDADWELRGIIDVEKCQVAMTPTKIEIKMKKAEPGSWSKLDFPKPVEEKKPAAAAAAAPVVIPKEADELVDLSDIY